MAAAPALRTFSTSTRPDNNSFGKTTALPCRPIRSRVGPMSLIPRLRLGRRSARPETKTQAAQSPRTAARSRSPSMAFPRFTPSSPGLGSDRFSFAGSPPMGRRGFRSMRSLEAPLTPIRPRPLPRMRAFALCFRLDSRPLRLGLDLWNRHDQYQRLVWRVERGGHSA